MMQFRSIGAIFLIAATALSAAEKPPPASPRTAVVIAAPAVIPGGVVDRSSFARALRLAVRNRLAGYLSYRGDGFDLFPVVEHDDPVAAVRAAVTDNYTHALYLHIDGRETQETTIQTDSHRRRFYTMAPGCLELTLTLIRLQPKGTTWRVVDSSSIRERSMIVRRADGQSGCEGFEPVLQRAVKQALGPVGSPSPAPLPSGNALPTQIYIPRDLLQEKAVTPEGAAAIVRMASAAFARAFGSRLQIATIKTLPSGLGLGGDIHAGQRRLRRFLRSESDTLVIAVNRQLTPDEQESGPRRDEIGLSQIGRRQVLVNLIPRATPSDTVWYTLANSLTVLHEIGHTLGAIHVSDMNSVMTHYATWTASDQFDPVNREIIEAALNGRLAFDDPAHYLGFVSKVLTSAAYNLADYPAFFHDYLAYRGNRRLSDTLRESIGRRSYLWAADGYGLLAAGRRAEAAKLFRKALRDDPHQASLYYYLSEATDGAESAKARRTAAGMGYLMAEDESERVGRADVDIGRQ